MELIGNTFEENAYHEAGHASVAAALGLDLRPTGIIVWSTAEGEDDIAGGFASYCKDTPDVPTAKKVLAATRAGQLAQLKQFPSSNTAVGSECDRKEFFSITGRHFPVPSSNYWGDAGLDASHIVDRHWNAIVEIVERLAASPWLPVSLGETDPKLTRKKQLDGNTLVAILAKHGISARVRP